MNERALRMDQNMSQVLILFEIVIGLKVLVQFIFFSSSYSRFFCKCSTRKVRERETIRIKNNCSAATKTAKKYTRQHKN